MAKSIPRFTKGISTMPPRHTLTTMPALTGPFQAVQWDEFSPYNASNYTVTQTNGTAAAYGFPSGVVQLSTTGTTTSDQIYLSSPALSTQFLPGNATWFYTRLAWRSGAAAGSANDTNLYAGLFDNAVPASASNGLYFLKPAGGSTVNLILKKATTVTTFQNVADLSKPSGLTSTYDPYSIVGTLTGTISGNALTAISVSTAGAGYMMQPIVINTTAAGSAGTAAVMLGSTTYGGSVAPSSWLTATEFTQIPYGSLAMPYITAAGSGYTNGTATFEVDAWVDLCCYFDGSGRMIVGVNGRNVMSIGGSAVEVAPIPMTPGNTYNLTTQYSGTGTAFSTIGTQLSTSIAPFQPALGSFYNVAPQVPLQWSTGFTNTTANARAMFIHEYFVANETN